MDCFHIFFLVGMKRRTCRHVTCKKDNSHFLCYVFISLMSDVYLLVFLKKNKQQLKNAHNAITVLSTSLGKTFFAWRFILNENILFCLTISYQKPLVFYVSVFYSQIFAQKLKLRPKVGLTYAISIVK